MPRRARPIALLLVVLALVIVVGAATRNRGPAPRPAPALPTQILNPPAQTLASLRGHVTLINFWASWCHPCAQEAPTLARLVADHPQIHLVAVDTGDDAGNARRFIRRYRWSFPILRDATNAVGDRYGISGLPTTFVVNARGQITRRLTGPQTEATLVQAARDQAG